MKTKIKKNHSSTKEKKKRTKKKQNEDNSENNNYDNNEDNNNYVVTGTYTGDHALDVDYISGSRLYYETRNLEINPTDRVLKNDFDINDSMLDFIIRIVIRGYP